MYCYNLIGLFGLCDNDFSNDFIVSFNVSIIFRNMIQLVINVEIVSYVFVFEIDSFIVLIFEYYYEI